MTSILRVTLAPNGVQLMQGYLFAKLAFRVIGAARDLAWGQPKRTIGMESFARRLKR